MTILAPGAVVGRRYRLDRELTKGGMGVVWAATHVVTKRAVAIKLLRAGRGDPASRARLIREARASCAVDHPSVLPVLDIIDADGAPALVMDLLEGESLRERLERERALGVREVCTILAPVAEALASAHAAGIVHRDVKPENIFLVGTKGGAPAVKVLDFGVAKIVATEEPTTNLTETGAMLGTPYYMAPEQAFGERDVGPAADAWALGIVLFECLTGTRPTQADNLGQVIKRITRDPLPRVEDLVPDLPPDLGALVARLLERDASTRETDMEGVAATLKTCAEPAVTVPRNRSRRSVVVAIASVMAVGGATASALAWRGTSGSRADTLPSSSLSFVSAAPSMSSSAEVPASSTSLPSAEAAPPRDAGARTAAPTPASARRAPAPSAAATVASADAGTTGPGRVIIETPF